MLRCTSLVISVFYLLACGDGSGSLADGPAPDALTECENTTPAYGFGISPQGFPQDFSLLSDFYEEVRELGDSAVMWNGGWRDDLVDGTDAGTVPRAARDIQAAGKTYCFLPISVFGWRTGATVYLNVPANEDNSWANMEMRSLFQQMLVDHVTQTSPPYIFIGNENSRYFELNEADYANWISFYNQAYDAIKAASPNTQVGTVFNFEHLAGSGTLNGWTTPHWGALTAHDLNRVDVFGITMYPFLETAQASDVPSTYLDPLFQRIGTTPIVITETGWPGENLGNLNPLWETSEQAQVDYLPKLTSILQGHNVAFVNWLFLNEFIDDGSESDAWRVFGSISLRRDNGEKRPIYDQWEAL